MASTRTTTTSTYNTLHNLALKEMFIGIVHNIIDLDTDQRFGLLFKVICKQIKKSTMFVECATQSPRLASRESL